MSIVDDFKAMVNNGPYDTGAAGEYYRSCIFCGARPDVLPPTVHGFAGKEMEPHAPDCRWLVTLRVGAVLEALDLLIGTLDYDGPWYPGSHDRRMICRCCRAALEREYHKPDCAWQMVLDVWQGET